LPATSFQTDVALKFTLETGELSTCRLPRSVWISPKNVFQVHGIDAAERSLPGSSFIAVGDEVLRGAAAMPGLAFEAFATAHYRARELRKLGQEVRLMPTKDVKAYAKKQKRGRQGLSTNGYLKTIKRSPG
jgi:hypothetical protein